MNHQSKAVKPNRTAIRTLTFILNDVCLAHKLSEIEINGMWLVFHPLATF